MRLAVGVRASPLLAKNYAVFASSASSGCSCSRTSGASKSIFVRLVITGYVDKSIPKNFVKAPIARVPWIILASGHSRKSTWRVPVGNCREHGSTLATHPRRLTAEHSLMI